MSRAWLVFATAQLWLAGCGNDLGYDTAASSGLPCDVQTFLADRCQGCHGAQLASGAPMPLLTYENLTARDATGATVAQRSLARLKSPAAQMPPLPAPAATASEIAMFEAWVTAGTPNGECAGDGQAVCSSGKTWTGGNRESPLMHPGDACIACHSSGEGPRFRIGGTVYPTAHEPNDCDGATSAAVEVTDAGGRVTTLQVNAAGNFFTSSAITFPIHVAVVANGTRRVMNGSPPTGDCNSCHTQDGANLAPGRIALP